MNESAARACASLALAALAAGCASLPPDRRLLAHEHTYVGYAKDERNQPHLDFQVSPKYLMFASSADTTAHWVGDDPGVASPRPQFELFGAATIRASQYIGTRESSPVVARRFNPELFLRHNHASGAHVDLSFGHESNGQSGTEDPDGDPATPLTVAELDKISRGWDYVGLSFDVPVEATLGGVLRLRSVQAGGRLFLDHGPLQGRKEEFVAGVDPSNEERTHYDGLRVTLRTELVDLDPVFAAPSQLDVTYMTGISAAGQRSTVRVEWQMPHVPFLPVLSLPFTVWGQTGYNSDLAHFYEDRGTVGFGFRFDARNGGEESIW